MKRKIKFNFKTEKDAKTFANRQYSNGIEVLKVAKSATGWYVIIRD